MERAYFVGAEKGKKKLLSSSYLVGHPENFLSRTAARRRGKRTTQGNVGQALQHSHTSVSVKAASRLRTYFQA